MVRQIAVVISVCVLDLVVGRVGGLASNVGAGSAVAWAQDSTQGQPESKKSPPPDVAGSWCGSINDMDFGMGTINLDVNQKGANLSGSWSGTLGGSGTFKGKINGDAITATLKERDTKRKVAMVGTLVESGEVTGTYSIFGCKESDGGSFDITSPTC